MLANLYLDPLDPQSAGAGLEMVRYADDLVMLCRSEAEDCQALEAVREWTAPAGGFDFLGYPLELGKRWPRRKGLGKLKDTIRAKTRRTSGQSLAAIIADLNRTLRGWFEYFKHSHRYTFPDLDQWTRMRLRSLLRRRQRRQGREQGCEHREWPNATFAQQGLFSLVTTHTLARQSSRR